MKLIAKPANTASGLALDIYSKVLDAVRADRLVGNALERVGDALFVQGQHIDLNHFNRVWIAGSGKASVSMAKAAKEILGDRLAGGLIITKSGSAEPMDGINVLEASHPIPDQSSLDAGDRMLEFAGGLNEKDLVIYLLSGGSSAMMESLRPSLDLGDLQDTNRVLLASGANIQAMNAIRTRLSRIKGGGLGATFAPATVVALVLSDVVGNDLSAVGSGPFITKPFQAPNYSQTPITQFSPAVQSLLAYDFPIPHQFNPIPHHVIGSVSLAIHAAVDACKAIGLLPLPFGDPMLGEARDMAKSILEHGVKRRRQESCMIFGGETTVTLRGTGLGGRCQEMALAVASPMTRYLDVCFLAAGTDGADGPTDAAGGFVDPLSLFRAQDAGFSAEESLANNDSYGFLNACDGLIFTGPTGSNVNDLALFVRAS